MEAIEHASAAGDHALAELLIGLPAPIQRGSAVKLFRWAQTVLDRCLLDYPGLAAARAAPMIGQQALERRRQLQLATRPQTECPGCYGAHRRCGGGYCARRGRRQRRQRGDPERSSGGGACAAGRR